jgi:hypothetical protein
LELGRSCGCHWIEDRWQFTIYNNSPRHGGGFWNSGDSVADLTDVIISNNFTGPDSGGTRTRGLGGGFYNTEGSTVNIDGDSQLTGNRAEDGGAFYNSSTGSTVNITGTPAEFIEIDGNTVRVRGGGFRSTGNTTVDLDYVDVTNNTTDVQRGGGFYADGARVIGNNVRINNNSTGTDGRTNDEQGGGFWLDGNGRVELTDSQVNNNVSLVHGGGGYNDNGVIELTRTTAEGNFANNSGGGFFLNNSSQLVMTDSSVSDNIARDHGGGFWLEDDSTTNAVRTSIDGNLAGYEQDGTTRRESGTAGIAGAPTGSDLRGGGFWASSRGIVTLTDSTVNDNEAARHGGGVNLENEAQLILNGTTVANNVSDNHGAGIRVPSNARLTATDSTISGNHAGFYRAKSGTNTLVANYNNRVAGGIWSQGGGSRTLLNHVTVSENRSTGGGAGGGAGVYRGSGFVQAENSIFYGNIADADLAAASQDASDVRGAITLVGANVLGAHSTGGGSISGDTGFRISVDPNLAALADNGSPITLLNGGTPQTHAIANSSAAAGAAMNSTQANDQRDQGRPGTSTTTSVTNVNTTGADLLTNPDFTLLDRTPTVKRLKITRLAVAVADSTTAAAALWTSVPI